ncbi:MAG: nitrous oxide reductase accessory protein NosL [Saprospiraceae bacterium]|nr:nitrous oxide reductase accessory protein NosL [Saprospiraceae bacterium]
MASSQIFKVFCFLICATFYFSCSVSPEPVRYGSDLCQTCKMGIVQKGFAAEIVTKKGRVYKFDDVGCQILFFKSAQIKIEDCAHILVLKHGTDQEWIEANKAIFITEVQIKSPMNFNYACYKNNENIPSMYLTSSLNKYNWEEIYSKIGQ